MRPAADTALMKLGDNLRLLDPLAWKLRLEDFLNEQHSSTSKHLLPQQLHRGDQLRHPTNSLAALLLLQLATKVIAAPHYLGPRGPVLNIRKQQEPHSASVKS